MILAVGGTELNCQAPPLERSGMEMRDVVMTRPCAVIEAWPPIKKPDWFCSTTYPLALRLPRICDGLGSLILFQTTDEGEGWMKVVVSPTAILNVCQLMNARSDVLMVRFGPEVVIVAVPFVTVAPDGLPCARGPCRK